MKLSPVQALPSLSNMILPGAIEAAAGELRAAAPTRSGLFPLCLEALRLRFRMRIYGYVVMPEHVHLLVSEPEHGNLAEAMHYLKLSFSKRARSLAGGPG